MSTKYFYWLVLVIFFTACRKSNYIPPVIPVAPVLPDSLIQWKEMGTVPGTYTQDIWFTSPAIGFAAGSQLFQTVDSGRTWNAKSGTSGTPGFLNLFFTDSKNGFAEGQSQVAVTLDGGDSWTIKPLPSAGALTIFFVNPSTGFYGDNSGNGLYKTLDGGSNWTSIFKTPTTPDNYYPYFLNIDTGFIATSSGLFASTTDGGQNWKSLGYFNSIASSTNSYNQLQFLDKNNGFYGCPSGVMKTTDGGQTWNNILPEQSGSVNVIKFFDAQSGFFKGSNTIYHTMDGGQTWTISCKIGSGSFIGMNFIDAHTGWACANNGRVFRIQQ
jgi:photosystem II stability/assembly factor-like uncharacterized protein